MIEIKLLLKYKTCARLLGLSHLLSSRVSQLSLASRNFFRRKAGGGVQDQALLSITDQSSESAVPLLPLDSLDSRVFLHVHSVPRSDPSPLSAHDVAKRNDILVA